jgi:hypothetical protein
MGTCFSTVWQLPVTLIGVWWVTVVRRLVLAAIRG